MKMPDSVNKCIEEMGGIEKLESRISKPEKLESQATLFNALSDETRLRIVSILSKMSSCVCVIKEITKTTNSQLSYHLTVLKDAGLVKSKKEKNWVIYSLTRAGKKMAENSGL